MIQYIAYKEGAAGYNELSTQNFNKPIHKENC